MKIKLTLKIKDVHNAPDFGKGWGPGVLATQEVDLPENSPGDLKSPMFIAGLLELCRNFEKEFIEVKYEIAVPEPNRQLNLFEHEI